MLVIAKKLGFQDLKSFNASIKENKNLRAKSGEQMLELYRKYISQMEMQLPKLFGCLPKAKLEIVEVESSAKKKQRPHSTSHRRLMDRGRGAFKSILINRRNGAQLQSNPLRITKGTRVIICKLRELRERAKTKLGDRFDIREFHDQVLGAGLYSEWIASVEVKILKIIGHLDGPSISLANLFGE